jgi:transposase
MSNLLGLPGLIVKGERETWDRLYIDAEVGAVLCPKCGSADELDDPKRWNPITINDTPARGRPTVIVVDQYRYRCGACARRFTSSAPEIDMSRKMTRRLFRYIQDGVMRRPRSAIADEVGISATRVGRIALELAERLVGHRFPTPRVLGIDDIWMSKKPYTIFTDSEHGHAIGLIASVQIEPIAQWIIGHLDRSRVEVVASDLSATIIGAVQLALPQAVHVVDRWHVQQSCQRATSVVITQTLAELNTKAVACEADGDRAGARAIRSKLRTIRSFRGNLLGRASGKKDGTRTLFDRKELLPVLTDQKRIGRAFRARTILAKLYEASDEASARKRLEQFYIAARDGTIAKEMEAVVATVRSHEQLILNYFVARLGFPKIPSSALTTSSTERRNGKVRRSWRAGFGVSNFKYLRMLALYEPWRLDRDILLCGGGSDDKPCQNTEGPVRLVPDLFGQAGDQPLTLLSPWRCQACRSAASADVQRDLLYADVRG